MKWGTTRITRMKPLAVQEWLKQMDAAPKTKGHVKAIMHRLYEKAMLWELVECSGIRCNWSRSRASASGGRGRLC